MSSSNPSPAPAAPAATTTPDLPKSIAFATAGLGGLFGWVIVHPFNTSAVRMNLAVAAADGSKAPSFPAFFMKTVRTQGIRSLYDGLSAGLLRQIFYATSRFGLFEVLRDEVAKHRETDIVSRLFCGVTSGALAAAISCPAEVTLVRLANDSSLPAAERRNYTGVANAFSRILKEEGPGAFFRGVGPFVNRAMLVGAVQVGTYDQFKGSFKKMGVTNAIQNVFCASMSSGLLYSLVTMPFETAKNRMAFQKADPVSGAVQYRSAIQTISTIAAKEGAMKLYSGFMPYYLRCGGHTVFMFMSMEELRKLYYNSQRGV